MNESVIWKPMAGGSVAGEFVFGFYCVCLCVCVCMCLCMLRIEDMGLLMIERQKILSQSVSGLCALGSGLSALI